jgi:hypothetical protein
MEDRTPCPTNTLGAENTPSCTLQIKIVVINKGSYTMTNIFCLMTTTTTEKPCRYRACKGRIHGPDEKCPVAASRGSKGGKGGTAWTKARDRDQNGNFKGLRPCGCPRRQHLPTCSLAFSRGPVNLREVRTVARKARRVLNLPDWYTQGLAPAPIVSMIRGVDAICSVCGTTHKAVDATKIHRDDIRQNPVRSVCRGCDQ